MARDNLFKYIRERYKVPAFRNKVVIYRGREFRIANVIGGGLLLRWQVIVHPTDKDLSYDGEADDVRRLQSKIRMYGTFIKILQQRIEAEEPVTAEWLNDELYALLVTMGSKSSYDPHN